MSPHRNPFRIEPVLLVVKRPYRDRLGIMEISVGEHSGERRVAVVDGKDQPPTYFLSVAGSPMLEVKLEPGTVEVVER